MTHQNRNPSIPAWPEDEPSSQECATPKPAYYDQDLEAWVLTSHADVSAALHDPALWPSSVKKGKGSKPVDLEAHRRMRESTRNSLSPRDVKKWAASLSESATAAAAALEKQIPLDILSSYAIPVCMTLAQIVTSVSCDEALFLYERARIVFEAAGEPYDSDLKTRAELEDNFLKNHFSSRPEGLGDSTFVAITQTIPGLLANTWIALAKAPTQWKRLHEQPDLVESSIDELIRCGKFLRILGRCASADTRVGGINIRKGQKLVLRLNAAQHDPYRYSEPTELLIDRAARATLSLGAGDHSCVGAGLIRMALATITVPLVTRFSSIELDRSVTWRGGSTFRTPTSLWVRLGENAVSNKDR